MGYQWGRMVIEFNGKAGTLTGTPARPRAKGEPWAGLHDLARLHATKPKGAYPLGYQWGRMVIEFTGKQEPDRPTARPATKPTASLEPWAGLHGLAWLHAVKPKGAYPLGCNRSDGDLVHRQTRNLDRHTGKASDPRPRQAGNHRQGFTIRQGHGQAGNHGQGFTIWLGSMRPSRKEPTPWGCNRAGW